MSNKKQDGPLEILGDVIEAYGSDRRYPNDIVDNAMARLTAWHERTQALAVIEGQIAELKEMIKSFTDESYITIPQIKQHIATLTTQRDKLKGKS